MARPDRKHDGNFSQSRDIREDRGARQGKFARPLQTTLTRPSGNFHEKDRHPHFPLPEHKVDSKRPVVVKWNQPGANKVTIAGTFNQWHPESTPLRRVAECEWATELLLPAGEYEYRFLVDGRWVDEPNAPLHVSNVFGGRNSVLKVS